MTVSASASGMALVWCTSTRRRRASLLEPSPPLWSRRPSSRCGSVKKTSLQRVFPNASPLHCHHVAGAIDVCNQKVVVKQRSPLSKLAHAVAVVVERSQLSVPLRSQSSTQVMPVLTHAILAESSSRASWSLPQQPSSCCRAPVSIHRTMSCSGVPTFTGPRHKWSSHRREFICPGPIREALLKCVLLVTSNCATSRNASSEHKLEGCRRRRAMPCQRHNPQQNLSRATTQ
jgi:hypothetical protein